MRTARFDLKLLTVPLVSSLDASDLVETTGTTDDLETYVLTRAKRALDAGCDGVIASGDAIQWCRAAFPPPTLIVSPGIRPEGAAPDDQKRHTTPADAIRRGADYLVVGRPILRAPDPARPPTASSRRSTRRCARASHRRDARNVALHHSSARS